LAFFGILARLAIVVLSGNQVTNSFSGGSDAPQYILLADNLYSGKGFSYVGQPSAFRPPIYPLILAGAHFAIGKNYLFGIRVLQLLAGIFTAWICARIACEIWGRDAASWCFALVLLFPTLVYFTGEILTETFASLLTALFLFFLVRTRNDSTSEHVRLGVIAGIAALLRFNTIFLPFIAAWRILTLTKTKRWQRVLTVFIVPFCIILPWIIRNLVVFHGEVTYSTHTGMDLIEGILEPEGRADTEQQQQILREAGWLMQGLERDDYKRLLYPSEPVLNRQAMSAALRLWRNAGWRGLRIIAQKLGYFWLSTDQLVSIGKFSFRTRFLRMVGVIFYWFSLAVAAAGLRKLLRVDSRLAWALILYLIIATGLHILFAMNTRLRVPLVDPLICILATFPFLSAKIESTSLVRPTNDVPVQQP
jgi:4-amino-4-deoxy-L-arabinose transferase-like glycosyltransferase